MGLQLESVWPSADAHKTCNSPFCFWLQLSHGIIQFDCTVFVCNRLNTTQIEGNWIANVLKAKAMAVLANLITNYVVIYKNSSKYVRNLFKCFVFFAMNTTNKTTHDFDTCRRVSVYVHLCSCWGNEVDVNKIGALCSPWPWFSLLGYWHERELMMSYSLRPSNVLHCSAFASSSFSYSFFG